MVVKGQESKRVPSGSFVGLEQGCYGMQMDACACTRFDLNFSLCTLSVCPKHFVQMRYRPGRITCSCGSSKQSSQPGPPSAILLTYATSLVILCS